VEITSKLAGCAAGVKYEQIPEKTVHQFKRALLDYLTAALTGSGTTVAERLLSYLVEADKSRDTSIIGRQERLSAMNAALVNGSSAHALDFDDGHTQGSLHPAGAVFPAVFAAAEHRGADAKSIITAVVLGYEITIRISAAMHPSAINRGFHNTPIAGVFGAAAGVSSLLRADPGQTLNALGLAGSFAGGLFEFLGEGAEVKRLHPGKAARDGLLCAELGKRGITGPSRVLEGRNGFFKAFAGSEVNYDRLLKGLGEGFEIDHIYFKPYPCCRHLHAVIDGIKKIKSDYRVQPDQVASVEVGLYEVGARHNHRHCDNLLDAQMSIPCAAALAVIDDEVSTGSFAADSVGRPEVQSMIRQVEVGVDPQCEKSYPARRSAVVEIVLRDGSRYGAKVADPRGEGDNPMSDADLEEKLLVNCIPIIGREKCRRLLEAVWGFERLTGLFEFYSWGV